MANIIRKLSTFVLVSVFSVTASAASYSDLGKETRWEEQIAPDLMVGDAIELEADGVQFLALYTTPANGKAKGAVIILHGIGVHPAWPEVIEPLRTQLPDHGWQTLSLQMPILENGAEDKDYASLFPEVPARIQAGVDLLKRQGVDTIVLTGHSLGATMASYYLAVEKDPAVKAFALVSAGSSVPDDERMNSFRNLSRVTGIQVLDMYGTQDRAAVLDSVIKRKALDMNHNGNHYSSRAVKGAGHFYRGKETALVKTFSDWLEGVLAR
jgi:dienelactone hydrolase